LLVLSGARVGWGGAAYEMEWRRDRGMVMKWESGGENRMQEKEARRRERLRWRTPV